MQKIVMKYVPSMLEEVQLKSCEEIKENLEICVFVQVGIWASDKYVIWMVQISPKTEILILMSLETWLKTLIFGCIWYSDPTHWMRSFSH